MPLIMITNDDGIDSPGLKALQKAMAALGRTVVVTPERDNSAVSHSLTMHRPLRINRISEDIYTLDGTPTDCVAIGLGKLLKEKPDLLVSGINAGPNLGDDISYSGTVSAAIEGTMYGIPSMALSLAADPPYDYTLAMRVAASLAERILANRLPENTLLNVNIPGAVAMQRLRRHPPGQTTLGKQYPGDLRSLGPQTLLDRRRNPSPGSCRGHRRGRHP